ncbi:ABC transporter permease [Nakamurella sp. PAMC28650]|uniref:ABC transporter permease n=1 Tax=Nakamurella sp. PAMC28650 TaxID=2762325 RepID=UPI00164E73A8|nr:ABC transporter permease [Nakamurella sp. PAMC28650]QNK82643.1 ABC transporter permease [Nakamurella sp. PAMC28650]
MKYFLYVVRRMVTLIPVGLGITLLVFLLLKIVPGDPAVTLLGTHVTDAGVAALHQQLGLDRPLWQQYLTFLGKLLHGDLGESYQYQSSVSSLVLQNLVPTIWLIVTGALFAVIIAVPLAVWAASHRNGVSDNAIRTIPLIGLGMPAFWLGIMLVLLFSLKAGAFPASGFGDGFANHVKSIVLPGLTVALALVPILVRSLRASMTDVLQSDYITTARAKGLGGARVVFGHALRNAAISSITVLGVNVAYLVGSTLVVEKVFALNGIGYLMINAIFNRDFPIVQGITLVFAVMVVLVNLLTDMTHAAFDPRVRLA